MQANIPNSNKSTRCYIQQSILNKVTEVIVTDQYRFKYRRDEGISDTDELLLDTRAKFRNSSLYIRQGTGEIRLS